MNINHGFAVSYENAAQIDARLLSTDCKTYIKKNAYQSSLCASVWVSVVSSINETASGILSDHITDFGLLDAIKIAQADVSYILSLPLGDVPLSEVLDPDAISPFALVLLTRCSIKDALLCLRFPKRFTPVRGTSDIIDNAAISSFKSLLNEVKINDRYGKSLFVVNLVKYEINRICKGYNGHDLYRDGYFSSGAIADGDKSLATKVQNWAEPNFGSILYPNLHWRHADYRETLYNDPNGGLSTNGKTAIVLAVPKSYKTPRLIAKEDSTRQWYLQAINRRLRGCIVRNGFSSAIPLDDQPHNQMLAMVGSNGGGYSTIDLSSASDRNSVGTFRTLFPSNVVHDVMQYRSSTLDINGKVYLASMVATSGSGVCFVLEAITFYAIAAAATHLVERLTRTRLLKPAAMGDDIIVDDRAYDTCVDFLTHFGFKVNDDKSFTGNHAFRESCGKDFFEGDDVTSSYWPRTAIERNTASLSSLIALHNALFDRGCDNACRILRNAITGVAGRRLSTTKLQDFVAYNPFDLKGYTTVCDTGAAPYAPTCDVKHYNELHDMIDARPVINKARRVDEMYYYVQYLIHGPLFADPFDELIGVSQSRVRRDDVSSRSDIVITKQPVF